MSNQGASSTPKGASVTTSSADDVIISLALVTDDITGIHSGNPFTEDSDLWNDGWAHLITSSTATYAAQWNQTPSASYGSSTASFKASSGGGSATYLLSASPTSLNFGNVTVGTQSILPIVLTNTGTGAVTITQDTITGAGFSGSGLSLPFTLSSGQNTDLTITFAPTATGSVTGSASVVSSASNSPTAVSLSGAGVNSHFVDLSWTASTSTGVTGYNVYRGTTSGGLYTQINSSPVAGTSYTDSNVVAGATYYYVTTAVNSSGAQSGIQLRPQPQFRVLKERVQKTRGFAGWLAHAAGWHVCAEYPQTSPGDVCATRSRHFFLRKAADLWAARSAPGRYPRLHPWQMSGSQQRLTYV